jgi:O-antigen ligase
MLLTAGIGPPELLQSRALRRLLFFAAACASILIVLNAIGVRLNANLPLVPLEQVGNIGGDGGTVFASFGLLALGLGLYSSGHRLGLLVSAIPLLAASLLATQRAAVLGLVAGLAVLAALVVTSRARRGVTVPELSLAMLGLIAVFLLPSYANAIAQRPAPLPLVATLESVFGNREKQLSAQDRVNQWERAPELIRERPFLGWGMGVTYVYWDPGTRSFKETFLVHDIWLDLAFRAVALGLVLFVASMLTSVGAAISLLRNTRSATASALAAASVAIIGGILVKGSVESIFEKYRIAIVLGFAVGLIASARGEPRPSASADLVRSADGAPRVGAGGQNGAWDRPRATNVSTDA